MVHARRAIISPFFLSHSHDYFPEGSNQTQDHFPFKQWHVFVLATCSMFQNNVIWFYENVGISNRDMLPTTIQIQTDVEAANNDNPARHRFPRQSFQQVQREPRVQFQLQFARDDAGKLT